MKDGHPYSTSYSYDDIRQCFNEAKRASPTMTNYELVSIVSAMTGLRHSTIVNALPDHVRRSTGMMA